MLSTIKSKRKRKNIMEVKQKLNISIDKDIYLKTNVLREFFFINLSENINSHLREYIIALEEQLQAEDPENYKKFLEYLKEDMKQINVSEAARPTKEELQPTPNYEQ